MTREATNGFWKASISCGATPATLGLVVRLVNTSPQYGFFFFMPFVFVTASAEAPYEGFMSAGQYSILVSLVYGTNIGANLFFGVAIPTALAPFIGYGGVVITYSALYVVSAVLTSFIVSPADPGEEVKSEEEAVTATA